MTIQEATRLAENGDVGAMLSLGDYYVQQKTGEGISQAADWYEAAAKKDVVYAVHMTVLCKKMLAYAGIQIASHDEFGATFTMNDWKEVYEWAAKELQYIRAKAPGTENINAEDARKNYADASYFYALSCYWGERFADVTKILSGFSDTRSKVLYGAAMIQLAETNAQMTDAFGALRTVLKDSAYASAEKISWEEDVYALAALQTSLLYKNRGSQDDLESAVSLLTFVLRAVRNENNTNILSEELKRYQKKLFGGYKYV